jgi:hypothetical protein
LHFNDIDLDQNLQVDLNEAFEHLKKTKGPNFMKFFYSSGVPSWFSNMDSNNDGILSPEEFDSMLGVETLRQFRLNY